MLISDSDRERGEGADDAEWYAQKIERKEIGRVPNGIRGYRPPFDF
jgi:hypothetical protein